MLTLSQRDAAVIWHPFTQMKTAGAALPVERGEGALLWIEGDTQPYIDAVASWWMNLHGHSHPYLAEALYRQARQLEHVIFANFTHEPAVRLAERLLAHLPDNQARIFYSDNGSTAVEVALKMALQYAYNRGEGQRWRFLALEGAYHGDTFGAMAVGARSPFSAPFDRLLFEVDFIPCPLPGQEAESLAALEAALAAHPQAYAGFIFEPLLQGAGGMRMYSPEILDQLIARCQSQGILCIADEVMTGFGRTGRFFATDALIHKPDIYCLSKGLTGGTMALGVTSCTAAIFEAFWSDDKLKALFHGHSCTANPLACAVALASMDLTEQAQTWANIRRIEASHQAFMGRLEANWGHKIENLRQLGVVLAFELKAESETSYFNPLRERIWDFFISRRLILRPLGNTIYILPPYCMRQEELEAVYAGIEAFLLGL